jgi:hypothetical protein
MSSYDLAVFEDLPSKATAVNSTNLNPIRDAVDDLDARASVLEVPAYAGARANVWNPATSIYNFTPANTLTMRAAVANARLGAGLFRVAWLGDSLTEGFGAVQGVSDPPQLVRGAFERAGFPVGTLIQPVNNGSTNPETPTFDTRITVDGLGVNTSATFAWLQSTGSGQSVTLTSDVAGTVLEVQVTGRSAWTYTVDGGSAITLPVSGTDVVELVTVTGLADTVHTVVLTSTATGANVNAIGIRPATGVVMDVHAVCGSSAADWAPTNGATGYAGIGVALVPQPDVLVMEIGIFGYLSSVDNATIKTQLELLLTTAQGVGVPVLLVASHRPADTDTYLAYLSMFYDLADEFDVPLLDLGDVFGLFSAWENPTLGLSSFGDVHMTPKGYASKASALIKLFPWLS